MANRSIRSNKTILTIDPITADNVLTEEEAQNVIIVSGIAIGGWIKEGDTLSTMINGTTYTSIVQNGRFSFDVMGNDLFYDTDFTVSITSTRPNGSSITYTSESTHTINAAPTVENTSVSMMEDTSHILTLDDLIFQDTDGAVTLIELTAQTSSIGLYKDGLLQNAPITVSIQEIIDGRISIQGEANFYGEGSIAVRASDGYQWSESAQLSITVENDMQDSDEITPSSLEANGDILGVAVKTTTVQIDEQTLLGHLVPTEYGTDGSPSTYAYETFNFVTGEKGLLNYHYSNQYYSVYAQTGVANDGWADGVITETFNGIIRYDASGNELWRKAYSESAQGVYALASNDSSILAVVADGTSINSNGWEVNDYYAVTLDLSGNELSRTHLLSDYDIRGAEIEAFKDGGFALQINNELQIYYPHDGLAYTTYLDSTSEATMLNPPITMIALEDNTIVTGRFFQGDVYIEKYNSNGNTLAIQHLDYNFSEDISSQFISGFAKGTQGFTFSIEGYSGEWSFGADTKILLQFDAQLNLIEETYVSLDTPSLYGVGLGENGYMVSEGYGYASFYNNDNTIRFQVYNEDESTNFSLSRLLSNDEGDITLAHLTDNNLYDQNGKILGTVHAQIDSNGTESFQITPNDTMNTLYEGEVRTTYFNYTIEDNYGQTVTAKASLDFIGSNDADSDTLIVTQNDTIDMSLFDTSILNPSHEPLYGIDIIDMTGNGAQSLVNLSMHDVFNLTDTDTTLTFQGDTGDYLQFSTDDGAYSVQSTSNEQYITLTFTGISQYDPTIIVHIDHNIAYDIV